MKKILSLLASFVLGFVFFMGGAAVATSVPSTSSEDQVSEQSPDSPEDTVIQDSTPGTDTYCFEIGKDNELGGDCFCVKDDVSDMAEVDCLINSGIVPASSRESYLREIELRESGSNPVVGTPIGDIYCFDIGKDNELSGDCFCVQDDVSDLAEVDCLINSGIVPPDSREDYIRYLDSLNSNT